jgi:hypothetical protein
MMVITYARTPQIYGDRRRIGDGGDVSDNFVQRFPPHCRPISQMPETGGVFKVYTRDYDPRIGPTFGFKHREQIYRRVPEKDFYGTTRYVTKGVIPNPVAFST